MWTSLTTHDWWKNDLLSWPAFAEYDTNKNTVNLQFITFRYLYMYSSLYTVIISHKIYATISIDINEVWLYMFYLCYIAMEKSPDEIIEFLWKHKDSHIKHCNVKVICSDLEHGRVISQGQRERLDNASDTAAANNLFYQFLRSDPASKTLEAAAKVLKEAPDSINPNKTFAEVIEDFLSLKDTTSGGYEYDDQYSLVNERCKNFQNVLEGLFVEYHHFSVALGFC